MLHQIRRHLRVLAATVLVSVSALGAWSSTVHELDCHDAECASLVVVHDASAHAFRGAARVQSMTRSVSGSPLATPCPNTRGGSLAWRAANASAGHAMADPSAPPMNCRRE